MRDLRAYWQSIRALEQELGADPETAKGVYLAHLESSAVVIAAPRVAAESLVKGTHRRATPVEIAAWEEAQERSGEEIRAHERRMLGVNQSPRERNGNARSYRLV